MQIGHKIATTVEVLVATGKILVANATTSVVILSPKDIPKPVLLEVSTNYTATHCS